MIRRSKITTAASSSRSSAAAEDNNINNVNDLTLEFASDHSSSDRHRLFQRYERLRSITSLYMRRLTSKLRAEKLSTKEHERVNKFTASTRCFFVVMAALIVYQLDAYGREYQGPLDHVSTTILKPYYGMFCPSFSDYHFGGRESSTSHDNLNGGDIISWDCNVILRKQTNRKNDGNISQNPNFSTAYNPSFPRIFMIGARDETQDTFQSWESQLFSNQNAKSAASSPKIGVHNSSSSSHPYLKRINTLKVSNQFATSGGALRDSSPQLSNTNNDTTYPATSNQHQQFLCRKIKWEQRLFYVYQHIFTELLASYPQDDGFVIVEDDATLLNPAALLEEVCHVHSQKIQFYSLYGSPLQLRQRWWNVKSKHPSCIYQHGTVAFYIRRQLMEQVVNEHRRSFFCRFPIDMYISKFGPWYASRRDVVGHLGRGRIGSS